MSRTLSRCVAFALAASFTPGSATAATLDAALREEVAKSVVQVQARGCPDTDRVGSGFAFGPQEHVATALHVVAGCERITVYWEKHGGATQQAAVVKVLNGADLALLQATGAPGRALATEARRPQADDELEALGYYLAVPTMDNKPLRVTFGSTRLRDMLPSAVRRELEQSGAIDLDLEIVRLDGHLLPGLSGAPIFDRQGRVVAVGSGGLKSGAASVSWAVPALQLDALLASTDNMTATAGSSQLFAAAEMEQPDNTSDDAPIGADVQPEIQGFTCGAVQFVYTGVRSFQELTYGHEDLSSIQYLIGESDLGEADLAQFRYHTFQPVDGGAAVAIPEWASVQTNGPQGCEAIGLDGRIAVDFTGYPVASLAEAQVYSQQFEYAFAVRSGRNWQPYAPYSYIGPMQRADGLIVNRKTFIADEMDGHASLAAISHLIHQPQQSPSASFTGLVGSYWRFNIQVAAYCDEQDFDPGCAAFKQEEKLATQMVLGIFLATAPLI
jgi:S1-C subfamily serine protease